MPNQAFLKFTIICLFFISQIYAENDFPQESSLARIQLIASNLRKASSLFTRLNDKCMQIKKPQSYGQVHLQQNRNPGFLPFDENRTCREIKNFYISASDVNIKGLKYIIAQAPLETTILDFWKVILYKNCQLIVTACMPLENNRDRCAPYWQCPYLPTNVLNWILQPLKEEVLARGPKMQKIVKRTFKAQHRYTLEKRTITQLHLENWPDYGVPELEIFQEFLNLVDSHSYPSKSPILVHCSAGIGRSGTFVAAHSLRRDIFNGDAEINVPQRIYDLRWQRGELVTTTKQFQFIYKALLPLLTDTL